MLQQLLSINTQQKSIGRETFENYFLQHLNNTSICVNDKLHTCVEYIAIKISESLNTNSLLSVLITGGGVYNTFLIDKLKVYYNGIINIPTNETIQFKEAIIFAYLGYLRINQLPNTLSSVTNATKNSCGGCIYLV